VKEQFEISVDTVLVAVQGPDRRLNVEVPTESPVGDLLPELVRVLGGQDLGEDLDRPTWGLGYAGSAPFPAETTLAQQGVIDGALLTLQPLTVWRQQLEAALLEDAPRGTPAPYSGPRARTRSVLPQEVTIGTRLQSAARAALEAQAAAKPVEEEEPAAEDAPNRRIAPHRLTIQHRPSLAQRLRISWRDTDYLSRLERVVQAPLLRRCVTIAVMSPKGGVGKTTTTALLGALFALLRRDRIVAVDTNPDFGSLGRSLAPQHQVFVDDLLEVLDDPQLTVTALDANLGRGAHGLMVLPSPVDPIRMARLHEDAYEKVVRRLQDLVGVVLMDCGTGLHEPTSKAALKTADQVVLVTDAEPATASIVAEAAALLRQEGVPLYLLVNKMPSTGSRLDVAALEAYIPQARGLVVLPSNQRAASQLATGLFDWRDAPAGWKRAIREVAAALVADWSELGATI
jgi:MinD-like ATPase involved in chromosome partitioning or flagellar assembly